MTINQKKFTTNMEHDLYRELKIAAATDGREMQQIVDDALRQYLRRRSRGPELSEDRDAGQRALAFIESLCGDDFCEDVEMRIAAGETPTEQEMAATKRLSAIYRAAHSHVETHSCYACHADWRGKVTSVEPGATHENLFEKLAGVSK